MAYQVTAGPTVEPLTLEEAIQWLKLNEGDDDDVVRALIGAAREYAEAATGRQLLAKTITEYWDHFPVWLNTALTTHYRVMNLGAQPLSSSTVVLSYKAAIGSTYTVFASGNYDVDIVSNPARIVLHENATWPTAVIEANAVKCEYSVGVDIPSNTMNLIRTAMRLLIAFWYENREDMPLKSNVRSADNLLAMCRLSF